MKYLICSGDSFTDQYHRSQPHPELDTSWPKWPELLGERLNMKVINAGGSGQGNEYIYSTIQDVIESIEDKSQIGLIIAAWSECARNDFQTGIGNPNEDRDGWNSESIDRTGNILGWVKRSLRLFKNLEYMCQYYDIPYIQFQMIPLFVDYLKYHSSSKFPGTRIFKHKPYSQYYDLILKKIIEYEKILDISKFIGWPGVEELGGFTFNYELLGDVGLSSMEDQYKFGLTISKLDAHPNAAGQVKIAEYLYDRLDVNVL